MIKEPNQKQYIPLGIAFIFVAGIMLHALQVGCIEGNSIIGEVIRGFTTPGPVVFFPVLAIWYFAVGDKKKQD
jgi:hypothetical protein